MEEYRSPVTRRVLSLTLEIIYLLTGEDYTIVKKTPGQCSSPHVSDAWSRTPGRMADPPILEGSTEQKILAYTNQIIQLLTEEVPVRYQDITVSFSMDEWEYVESHKDLYKEIVQEDRQPHAPTGASSNKEELEVHMGRKEEKEEVQTRCDQKCKEQGKEVNVRGEAMCKEQGKEVNVRGEAMCKEEEAAHVWHHQPCKEEVVHVTCDQKCKEEEINTNVSPAPTNQSVNPEITKEVFVSPKVSPKELAFPPEVTLLLLTPCYEVSDPGKHLSTLGPDAECEKTSNVTEQQTIHTSDDKLFLCTDCGKCFALKADLIQHWRVHMKEKPFQCGECGECFTSMANCTKHFRIHRGKTPFQCPECGKCFNKKSTYSNHQRVHRGGPQYPCTKCSKSFAHKCSLVKHKRTHAGERAFSCSECEKSFSEKCDFVRHLRIHTGEKPYSCTECGKGFTQKSNLARHQKTHMT